MSTISQRDLRNHNASIVRRVEAGERFTVTRRGVPVADLVPHDTQARIDVVFVASEDILSAFASDSGGPDIGAWLRESRAADDLVNDSDHDPWGVDG
ncbi:MAG: type II toxin-antitoxin system prevent-host-death family antitoxin [Nocardioidaceae bacterium]|nr:type II toxin-antitoxin system prevent-host-death family antitoxin [Nocardioidaceae bacterium]